MSAKYSIDQTTKTLTFTGKPKSLGMSSIRPEDEVTVTSIVIPNSVSSINDQTFTDCTALASVHVPSSVNVVGRRAFLNCTALTSVHIPNSVDTIMRDAFLDCRTLTSVHIPNSVKFIGIYCFQGCEVLHKTFLQATLKNFTPTFGRRSFKKHTSLIRPRLAPILRLQRKSALQNMKAKYSIVL